MDCEDFYELVVGSQKSWIAGLLTILSNDTVRIKWTKVDR